MLIAQITDSHVTAAGTLAYGVIDTNAHLAAAVAHLNQFRPRPDLVLITGDLVDQGQPAQYAALRDILSALELPYRLIVGNHDDRDALCEAFPDHAYLPEDRRFLHYTVEDFPIRVIALDTVIPDQPHGMLCPERVDWLTRRLAESPERPTLIAMHHPPMPCGIAHMDAMRCFGTEPLPALFRRFGCVQGVICGHLHRPVVTAWHGTMVFVCPSTAHQVGLTLGPNDGGGVSDEPPAAALHLWQPDAGLISHHSFIGGFRITPFRS
jgi:3',5'-cyclic AMP phosphodiesterase CpdA